MLFGIKPTGDPVIDAILVVFTGIAIFLVSFCLVVHCCMDKPYTIRRWICKRRAENIERKAAAAATSPSDVELAPIPTIGSYHV